MGAAGDAGLDHRLAVEGVGADQIEDHAGARGHRRQRGRVADVGDERLGRDDAYLGEHPLELGRVAPRYGPLRAELTGPLGEVRGNPPAGELGAKWAVAGRDPAKLE